MSAVDTFERRSLKFSEWFTRQAGASIHPSLYLQDLRHCNAGRGLTARNRIEGEVELFRIPRAAIITVENSSLAKAHPSFFEDVEAERAQISAAYLEGGNAASEDGSDTIVDDLLDPWLRLIVTLVYESLQGDKSPWKPYFDVLPTSFDTPMFWTEGQLSELQASDLCGRIGRDTANEMFETKVVPLIRYKEDVFQPQLRDDEIVALAHRMGSTIMAYAFDLLQEDGNDDEIEDGWVEDRDGQLLGMVPMADMLNADAEFNAHLNHDEEALVMVSLRPIEAGEEVLNYYGPLPNSELLRRYGYVSARHDAHNVVELSWDLVLAVVRQHLNISGEDIRKALATLVDDEEDDDGAFEDSFVFEYSAVTPDATGVLPETELQVLELPESLRIQLKGFFKHLRKFGYVSEAKEQDLCTVVKLALQKRLGQYTTAAEEDERLLRDERLNIGDDGMLRRYMAIKVRLGEKQLLSKAIVFIQAKIDELDSQRPKKRTKVA